MIFSRLQKFVLIPVLLLAFLGPILSPFAESFNFPDRYDLVAILVEQEMYQDAKDYDGLDGAPGISLGAPISSTNLKERIDRYAFDLQKALPGTRAVIIQTDRFEETQKIASVLERLYFEGDPKEPTRVAYLKGVVVIGEVPLPVVNKNGNRFISLYPYTDFEQKAYVWNPEKRDFEYLTENSNPQPEIWHGVITPPVSTKTEEGKSLLAAYFDKNHLYHEGDSSYAEFDRKVFIQDFVAERKNMNEAAFKSYMNFMEHMDDVAYFRYTKQLYQDLAGPFMAEVEKDKEEARDFTRRLDAAGIPSDDTVPDPEYDDSDIPEGARENAPDMAEIMRGMLPDISTKTSKMTDRLMGRFNEIFSLYPALLNDAVEGTGRYIHMNGDRKVIDYDSAVDLITAKDREVLGYLKAVNDMVEAKIDEIVTGELQEQIPIGAYTIQATKIYYRNEDGEIESSEAGGDVLDDAAGAVTDPLGAVGDLLGGGPSNDPVEFVNFAPSADYCPNVELGGGDDDCFPDRLNGYSLAPIPYMTEITSVAQCSPYRGSRGSGKYSKLVEMNRALNENTGRDQKIIDRSGDEEEDREQPRIPGGRTPEEVKRHMSCYPLDDAEDLTYDCEGYRHFAGCFYDGSGTFENPLPGFPGDSRMCFPEHAVAPVFDIGGTREITAAPPANYDNFFACLKFYEKNQYASEDDVTIISGAEEIDVPSHLQSVRDRLEELAEESDCEAEDPPNCKRTEMVSRLVENLITPAEKDPSRIVLYEDDVGDVFSSDVKKVTMAQILRATGKTLPEFLLSPNGTVIFDGHPNGITQVQLNVTSAIKKRLPSVFFHKAPTNEMANIQQKNFSTRELPVDNPRYVTFRKKGRPLNESLEKIIYPDVFSELSFDDYLAKLRDAENAVNCRECLMDLVGEEPEDVLYPPDTPNHEEIIVKRANLAKVKDGLEWRNMDVDAKHQYLLSNFLDQDRSAHSEGEIEKGYEMVYLNGEGAADRYEFSVNMYNDVEEEAADIAGEIEEEEAAADESGAQPTDLSYDLWSWSPPPISPWWERMKEWADEMERTVQAIEFAIGEEDFYAGLKAENEAAAQAQKDRRTRVEQSNTTGEALNLSHIKSMALESDFSLIVADKKAVVNLKLLDENDELVQDEFTKVDLKLEGGEFSKDPGNPLMVIGGKQTIGLNAPEAPGVMKLTAQIVDTEIRAEISLQVVEVANLKLEAATLSAVADSAAEIAIDVTARDAAGNVVNGANGKVNAGLSEGIMGSLTGSEIQLERGRGRLIFTPGKKAGKVIVNATASSLDPGQLELTVLPGSPKKIELTASAKTLKAISGESVEIFATLFDGNGNVVDTNSALQIDFSLAEKSARFGDLSSPRVRVASGRVKVTLSPREETGLLTVIAESVGIQSDVISIKTVKVFDRADVMAMKPHALTATLLGIPAGNVAENDYLGGWFLMNGKIQGVNSLTAAPKQYEKLFEVNDRGGLRLPVGARVSVSFLPANNFTFLLRDEESQTPLAKVTIFTFKDGKFEITDEADPSKLANGIYMRRATEDRAYQIDIKKGALRVAKDDAERVEVQTNGFVRIFDENYSVRPKEGDFLVLEVLDGATQVAEIMFVQRFNQDVRIREGIAEAPGVYVQPFTLPQNLEYAHVMIGNSSNDPRGAAFFDKNLPLALAKSPGFSYRSLEDAAQKFGVGFEEDNKFALLFSGGEIFGEANRPYASDIGIVLGDPTVKLNNTPAPGTRFSKDIGRLILASSEEVQSILPMDFNSDGHEDILVMEGKTDIRLIQNNGGINQLKDQGVILRVKNGIQDIVKVDVNKDRQMDLVIAGKVSCRKGDTCLDVYENHGGAFVRKNLRFDQEDIVVTLEADDLNADSFPDLILVDAAGDVRVIYNRRGEFDSQAQLVGNVGLQIDEGKNLATALLLHYPGMTTKIEGDPESMQKYRTFSISEPNPVAAALAFGGTPLTDAARFTEKDFIYADLDISAFSTTTKYGKDLNGGVLRAGDRINYTITLQNKSFAPRSSLMVSDVISEQMEVDPVSIICTDCAAGEMKIEPFSGDKSRPFLFKNIRVPANSRRTITYETIFKGDTESAPKVNVFTNRRFTDPDPDIQALFDRDDYTDISITKSDNPTGQVRYFYTRGIDRQGNLVWDTTLSTKPAPVTPEDYERITGADVPTPEELMPKTRCKIGPVPLPQFRNKPDECKRMGGRVEYEEPPPGAQKRMDELQNKDSDGDGLQDSIDDLEGGLDGAAEAVSGAISALTCSAGCIPMPLNVSFLTPGFFSVMGIPAGYDMGLPILGWGAPSIVPTFPPMPPLSTLGGRFYISPTLTGGVGFSLCLAVFGIPGNCFSFGINILDLLPGDICGTLQGAMEGALSVANSAISDLNEGVTMALGEALLGGATGTQSHSESGSGALNYSLGSYESPVATSRNIRIPGFPSVLTDWIDRQMEEFTDKIMNLPDLYVIYPDIDSITNSIDPTIPWSEVEKTFSAGDPLTGVLNFLNSMPIVDIDTQEVTLKIPFITLQELERVRADALQWVDDLKLEVDRWTALMGCVDALAGTGIANDLALTEPESRPDSSNLSLCKIVTVDVNNLIRGVNDNLRALDLWFAFPKQILQYRAVYSYYLGQVVDYLDAIIEFSGGWVQRNAARVRNWRKAVGQIRRTIEDFKGLMNLMVDYQESCDACKTERFSLMELIMKVLVAIPSPPVIPLPKLPDIIVDVSNVQIGLKIYWPDIKFKIEPFTLPKLPRIHLGLDLDIPLFKAMIPELPVIPAPPELPALPSLPALKLPKLPDLPPAPTIPALPDEIQLMVGILKKITKIYCMIKLGFMPTEEWNLKPRIEQITARGLTPLLPIDTMLTVATPSISVEYVDQIIVKGVTNLTGDFKALQKAVETGAQAFNKETSKFVKGINDSLSNLFRQADQYTSPTFELPLPTPEGRELNGTQGLEEYREAMKKTIEAMGREKARREKEFGVMPKSVTLKAETVPFDRRAFAAAPVQDSELVLPFQKRLKAYRDSLAAYVSDTEKMTGNEGLAENFDAFQRFIAENRSPFAAKSLKRYLGMNELKKTSAGSKVHGPQKLWEIDWDAVSWVDGGGTPARILAQAATEGPAIPTHGFLSDGAAPSGVGLGFSQPQNRGIFFTDLDSVNKRLINYTKEVDRPSQVAAIDLDGDDDKERVFSYGNNVFAKVNFAEEAEDTRPVFRAVDIEYWTISELAPKGPSANFPKSVSEDANAASFSFMKAAMPGAAGFEMVAKHSPFFFENPASQDDTLRAHFLIQGEPPAEEKKLEGTEAVIADVYATVKSIAGNAIFTGRKREFIQEGSGVVKVFGGDMLHPLEEVELKWGAGSPEGRVFELDSDALITVPPSLTTGLDIEMEDGALEIIRSEESTQPPAAGMAILFGDKISVDSGSVTVRYEKGGDTVIGNRETFVLNQAEDADKPTGILATNPAFYFGKIYAFDNEGNRSTASEKFLMAPQVCGDESPPTANLGKANFVVAVGKTLPLDATRSFDSDGRVISYWLDTDAAVDADGDGIPNNDRDASEDTAPTEDTDGDGNAGNDADSPEFALGPYPEIGTHAMRLTVRDEGLNEGYQDITVQVVTPVIVLEGPPLRSSIIQGYIEPREANVPITIARLRQGSATGWEILRTPSADAGGQYYTNADGVFKIEDADLRRRMEIRDRDGNSVGEINGETGRVTPLDPAYMTSVLPPVQDVPLRVGLVPQNTANPAPFTAVFAIPDVNTDTVIDGPAIVYDRKAFEEMSGVHVKPSTTAAALSFSFRVLPADDPYLPGATAVEKENLRVATIDVNGDFFTTPDSQLLLRVKAMGLPKEQEVKSREPVVFELVYKNIQVVAEMFIAVNTRGEITPRIVAEAKSIYRPLPGVRTTEKKNELLTKPKKIFDDIPEGDPFADTARKLFDRGIIAGSQSADGKLVFNPDKPINRAEFTQIILKLLCITPREEAYRLPPQFYDVLDPKAWFYAVLKEGGLRGFIKGYLGDARADSDGITRTPFRPGNNITWAESATVMLAALKEQGIISFTDKDISGPPGRPWYEPHVKVARDLTPYLKKPEDKTKRPFLLTQNEAGKATEAILRRNFAEMASRVLPVYDCANPDSDLDGLPDIWESEQAGAKDIAKDVTPQGDLDGDQCDNATEFEYGTNPLKADTDGGGANDCAEIAAGTNPVDDSGDEKVPPGVVAPPGFPGGEAGAGGGVGAGGAGGAGLPPGYPGGSGIPAGGPGVPSFDSGGDTANSSQAAAQNQEGNYMVQPNCGDICPCRATIGEGADLANDDIIFAAISGPGGTPIYAKSNEETY